MPFDKPTRNALARMVGAARERLKADLTAQLQTDFRLQPEGTAPQNRCVRRLCGTLAGATHARRTPGGHHIAHRLLPLVVPKMARRDFTEGSSDRGLCGFRLRRAGLCNGGDGSLLSASEQEWYVAVLAPIGSRG